MANKKLFGSASSVPVADTTNNAGGKAYSITAKHALAQLAVTGCMNNTYYVKADDQLSKVMDLCKEIDNQFIAKTAIYCRKNGYMKDMPALLAAVLASREKHLTDNERRVLGSVFSEVMDNVKVLRNFAQIVRSGVTGRKSFGSRPRRMIRDWFDNHTDEQLFRSSIGNNPSMADLIKMVHPKPINPSRNAMYGYLLGKEYDETKLPQVVRDYEAFKKSPSENIPAAPFEMLTSLELDKNGWIALAKNASWQQTRMNLNTFTRHGVFDDKEMIKIIADRLRNETDIKRSKVFPYQLMAAFMNVDNVPQAISLALQDAMEIAVDNVPTYEGKIYVFPDVSGSMKSPVTGNRGSATTKVRCIDVAALIAASILRKNNEAVVVPFEGQVRNLQLNPRDSIMTNAQKLASIGGGSTCCSAPLAMLNQNQLKGDLCIYVSDNESWIDPKNSRYNAYYTRYNGTETMTQWNTFKKRNPSAKMVCIDLTPNATTQAPDDASILNVGGFSDNVFELMGTFVKSGMNAKHFVEVIESVEL